MRPPAHARREISGAATVHSGDARPGVQGEDMTAGLAQPGSRDAQLRALGHRFQRPARDALILVGIGRALWYFFVQDIQPWNYIGVDTRAYWGMDLAHPLPGIHPRRNLLLPLLARVCAADGAVLGHSVSAVLGAVDGGECRLARVAREAWPWVVPMLILPIIYELCVGNIHFLLAATAVVGYPMGDGLAVSPS